jgi:hypothetical protein
MLVVAALVAVLAWAWYDGGERPVEWIEEPLPLPEDRG